MLQKLIAYLQLGRNSVLKSENPKSDRKIIVIYVIRDKQILFIPWSWWTSNGCKSTLVCCWPDIWCSSRSRRPRRRLSGARQVRRVSTRPNSGVRAPVTSGSANSCPAWFASTIFSHTAAIWFLYERHNLLTFPFSREMIHNKWEKQAQQLCGFYLFNKRKFWYIGISAGLPDQAENITE